MELTYQCSGGVIDILRMLPEDHWDGESPYEPYPDQFPITPFDLERFPSGFDELQAEYRTTDHDDADWPQELAQFMSTPAHQVFGAAYCHDWTSPSCVNCGKPMDFLATVADSASRMGDVFVDNPYVMVVFYCCRSCKVVTGSQQCD